MKLFKKSERTLNGSTARKAFRETGFNVKDLGMWCKWKEIEDGRLQVKIQVYEVKDAKSICYLVCDTLDRVAAPLTQDKQEVLDWLKEKGYKREKQWYLEECGMTEETWNIWNGTDPDADK